MTDEILHERTLLSTHLAARREDILRTWREHATNDPVQTTVSALTRQQFDG